MSDSALKKYRELVRTTDQFKEYPERSKAISFKNIRRELDYLQQSGGANNDSAKNRIGDIIWYVTNLANHFALDLEEIISINSKKISDLYDKQTENDNLIFHSLESLPDKFELAFIEKNPSEVTLIIKLSCGEYLQIGDTINDNSHAEDHYRFHDVFHLAYLVYLNWSPVLRALFKRKRKSIKKTDVVEDGARAAILEEAISAVVFQRAKKDNFFDGKTELDYELLDLIKGMVPGLEVARKHHLEWEKAILKGFNIFRQLVADRGGIVVVSRADGRLDFKKISDDSEIEKIHARFASIYSEELSEKIKDEIGDATLGQSESHSELKPKLPKSN